MLGADLPVRDDAIGVGHEDREVANVLDGLAVDVFGSPVNCAALRCAAHDLPPGSLVLESDSGLYTPDSLQSAHKRMAIVLFLEVLGGSKTHS